MKKKVFRERYCEVKEENKIEKKQIKKGKKNDKSNK